MGRQLREEQAKAQEEIPGMWGPLQEDLGHARDEALPSGRQENLRKEAKRQEIETLQAQKGPREAVQASGS